MSSSANHLKHRVVVCHVREDGPRARRLIAAIESELPDEVWSDAGVAQGAIDQLLAMNHAISAATVVITVWSRDSIKDEPVIGQTLKAFALGKSVGVLVDGDVDVPVPFNVSRRFDLSDDMALGPGSPSLQSLVDFVKRRFAEVAEAERERRRRAMETEPHVFVETLLPWAILRTPRALEGTIIVIAVAGEGGGRWAYAVRNGRVNVIRDYDGRSDAQVSITADNFKRFLGGLLDARAALDEGTLTLTGNLETLELYREALGWTAN